MPKISKYAKKSGPQKARMSVLEPSGGKTLKIAKEIRKRSHTKI